jgi:hypothetical protein
LAWTVISPTEFWATHSYTFSSRGVRRGWIRSTAPELSSNSIVCHEWGRKDQVRVRLGSGRAVVTPIVLGVWKKGWSVRVGGKCRNQGQDTQAKGSMCMEGDVGVQALVWKCACTRVGAETCAFPSACSAVV